ncbi:MAG: E3 ubiquitin-protein ligase hrd1 [Piccolia ochrophora]|nr:MAG: E3 ubiquitin-protein ligase hrd1 [Piccolia ochrophora]
MLGLQRLLYGPLRPIETEQLYEKAWFAITETCLAMTIFRDEVGAWFLVMFVSLLVGKVWGWIGEGRVEILEQQPPANPRLFHARLSFSLFISLCFDAALLKYTVQTVLQQARPNMMVMFAFEFAVLTLSSSSTAARYAISLTEAYKIKTQTRAKLEERRAELRAVREELRRARTAESETGSGTDSSGEPTSSVREDEIDETDIDVPGWEDKGQWIFYLDLITDFLKLAVYVAFFTILLTFYGLPIHIMRDLFLTFRSFTKRVADFIRYRNATRDMNARYPDASAEEIAREEVCIICREEMRAWHADTAVNEAHGQQAHGRRPAPAAQPRDERSRPKKLPCGHILHFGCLRSWLERQQICPTCRRSVMVSPQPTDQRAPHNATGNGQDAAAQQQAAQRFGGAPGIQAPNRGRVYNFGPFRVGVGVGQGVAHDLARQIHNGQPGPLAGPRADRPANEGRGMEMGVGFAFGRPHGNAPRPQPGLPQPPTPNQQASLVQGTNLPHLPVFQGRSTAERIQYQVWLLEALINREINDLRVSTEQLRTIYALQGELTRLRQGQASIRSLDSIDLLASEQHNGTAPAPQALLPHPGRGAMGPGHPELPPGVTLPSGWTILPLQRVAAAQAVPVATNVSPGINLPGHAQPTEQSVHANPTVGSPGLSHSETPTQSSNETDLQAQNKPTPRTDAQSSSIVASNTIDPLVSPSSSPLPTTNGTGDPGTASRPTSIPSWGSERHDNLVGNFQSEDTNEARKSDLTADAESWGNTSVERRQSKGKGKATVVEDVEDSGS